MKNITLEELLEAGCHFGHQVARQNSKAREFIFEARDGIHIIDLEKTKEGLDDAAAFVKNLAQKGGTILVLSTKKQAQEIIKAERQKVTDADVPGMYFVTQRWIGGTLTNFSEVAKNFKRLQELKKRVTDEFEKAKYTKKELGDFDKLRIKLESFYGGIEGLTKIPDALFIVDTHIENVAVQEALRMGVPTVGITDTNADPTLVDYPIPANDDAKKSLELIIGHIVDAWIEGSKTPLKSEDDKEKQSASAEATADKGEKASTKKKEKADSDKPATSKKKTVAKKEEKETK